jgi:uncharacterized LabA/DUF88 family protein
MRAYIYVDGFNLYYRALQGSPYKWLDIGSLAKRLLDPADTISKIRYFSARVSSRAGDPDAPRRQQIYFSALKTLPHTEIHLGRFLTKTKKRPLVSNPTKFVEVHDTEEKGSDVNLAAHLINDGWHGRYDIALIMSQDTDLVEPIRMVSSELNKIAGLAWLDGRRPSRHLAQVSSFVRHVTKSDLAASQFPNPLPRNPGGPIHKPASW